MAWHGRRPPGAQPCSRATQRPANCQDDQRKAARISQLSQLGRRFCWGSIKQPWRGRTIMALGGLGPQTRETHREKGKAQHGSAVLRLSAIRGDAIRGRGHDTSTRAQGTYVLLVQILRPSGRRGHGLQRGKLAAANHQNRPTMAPFPPLIRHGHPAPPPAKPPKRWCVISPASQPKSNRH